MFDRSLNYLFSDDTFRVLPKLDLYVKYLEEQATLFFNIFKEPFGFESRGMMLLEHVLGNADILSLRKITDPFERYEKNIVVTIHSLRDLVDPYITGNSRFGNFIDDRGNTCDEYLFPVYCDDPFKDYPLDKGFDAWEKIYPLKMADVASDELSFYSYLDCIKFKKDKPKYAIFTLDIAALILKYIAYLDQFTDENIDGATLPRFLHQYVVMPCLIMDELRQWLITQYQHIINGHNNDTKIDYAWITASNIRIGSEIRIAMSDVTRLCEMATLSRVSVPRFLNSLRLPFGNNVSMYYQTLQRYAQFPDERQYRWCEFLRDYRYLDLFLDTMSMNKDHPQVQHCLLYLQRDINLLNKNHPWTDISMYKTKTLVTEKVEFIKDKVDSLLL